MTELKDRIIFIRGLRKMNVREFARALGVTPSYIYGLESGDKASVSDSLAELIETKFSVNKEWLKHGEGPVYSTSVNAQEQQASVTDLVMRNIDRTDRMLEIVTSSPHHGRRTVYHLARFRDGHCLLITGMLPYDDKSPSTEITDIRDELRRREIPVYQLQVEEHWFAELTAYPRMETLQELFMRYDARPLGEPGIDVARAPVQRYVAGGQAQAPEEENVYDLLKKAGVVLESRGIYRTALVSNINAFHHSIRMAEELAALKARMDTIEAQTKTQFNELAQLIKGLQEENRILKQRRSTEEDPPTIDASSHTDQPSSRKTE